MDVCTAQSTQGYAVGIDIGTTTVSAVVYDLTRREPAASFTEPHGAGLTTDCGTEQSVAALLGRAEQLLNRILDAWPDVVSIGLSGQMHGIVYVNARGEPVSNLMNWQDKRAEQPLDNGETACQQIFRLTGEKIPAGYGLTTHYYNLLTGRVPETAVSFCSIMDLFAMGICGLQRIKIHTSVAASFGLFDIRNGRFQEEKLSALGMDSAFLPAVTGESTLVGDYRGIPVSVALGDNQASVLGAVKENRTTVLANIGTGAQISAVCDARERAEGIELRPFIEGKYLLCGATLCGGYAYAMLEAFFRSYAVSAGMAAQSQYPILNALAEDAYQAGRPGLPVDTSFCGKRNDPDCRGTVTGIGRDNFTPGDLALGVLKGMCTELHELYGKMPCAGGNLVASGGAVRSNPLLRTLLEDQFGASVFVTAWEEEAATGAALFSAFAAGKIQYRDGFLDYIRYD